MAYFYKDPWQQILDELNTKNSETLFKDLTRDNVEPNGDIKLVDADNGDSTITIKAIDGAGFIGAITDPDVTYHRYVASKLFPVNPRVDVIQGETHAVVVQRLATRYNLPPFILEGDNLDFTLSDSDVIESGEWDYKTLSFTFASNSVGYTGVLNVLVYNRTNDLDHIITDRNLDVLVYPDETEGEKGSLSILSYPVDYSLTYSDWENVNVGDTFTTGDNKITEIIDNIVTYYKLESGEASKLRGELNTSITSVKVKSITKGDTISGLSTVLTVDDAGGAWKGEVYITESKSLAAGS